MVAFQTCSFFFGPPCIWTDMTAEILFQLYDFISFYAQWDQIKQVFFGINFLSILLFIMFQVLCWWKDPLMSLKVWDFGIGFIYLLSRSYIIAYLSSWDGVEGSFCPSVRRRMQILKSDNVKVILWWDVT